MTGAVQSMWNSLRSISSGHSSLNKCHFKFWLTEKIKIQKVYNINKNKNFVTDVNQLQKEVEKLLTNWNTTELYCGLLNKKKIIQVKCLKILTFLASKTFFLC